MSTSMVKAEGEKLVISYQRPGEATPRKIEFPRPRSSFMIFRDPENATRRDQRAIGQVLAEDTNVKKEDVKIGRNGLTVSRVQPSGKVELLRMWDLHAGDELQKAKKGDEKRIAKQNKKERAAARKERNKQAKIDRKTKEKNDKETKKKQKKETRARRKLEKRAASAIKENLLYARDTAYIPFTPPWNKKRDIRTVMDLPAGALATGRIQERLSYKRRKKADPDQQGLRGFEWGRWFANRMTDLPVIGLGSDAKVAKRLIKNLRKHNSNAHLYNGVLAQLENGILDPMNEIHGVASSLSEVVTEMQRGVVGFATRYFFDKHPLLQDFSELAVIGEKVTSPDPKDALAKLTFYSLVRNALTGHHDEKSIIGRFLMKVEERGEKKTKTPIQTSHKPENQQKLAEAQKKEQRRRERHQKFWEAVLPQPSVLEEAYDRKVDRQNMVAVALTYLVLNPTRPSAIDLVDLDGHSSAYEAFKRSLASDFVKSMDAKPTNLHIFARRGIDFVDSKISTVESTIEANIPGGHEIAKILLGKSHDIKDATLAEQYKADGQTLLELYDNGGTKQQFIQLTAQLATKYVATKDLPRYQRELWRQAADYAKVVEDTYQAAQQVIA